MYEVLSFIKVPSGKSVRVAAATKKKKIKMRVFHGAMKVRPESLEKCELKGLFMKTKEVVE